MLIAVDTTDTVTTGCDSLRTETYTTTAAYVHIGDSLIVRLVDDTATIRGVWLGDTLVLAWSGPVGRLVQGTFLRR